MARNNNTQNTLNKDHGTLTKNLKMLREELKVWSGYNSRTAALKVQELQEEIAWTEYYGKTSSQMIAEAAAVKTAKAAQAKKKMEQLTEIGMTVAANIATAAQKAIDTMVKTTLAENTRKAQAEAAKKLLAAKQAATKKAARAAWSARHMAKAGIVMIKKAIDTAKQAVGQTIESIADRAARLFDARCIAGTIFGWNKIRDAAKMARVAAAKSWEAFKTFLTGAVRTVRHRVHSSYAPKLNYGTVTLEEPIDAVTVLAEMKAERDRVAALPVVARIVEHIGIEAVDAARAELKAVEHDIEGNNLGAAVKKTNQLRGVLANKLGKARQALADALAAVKTAVIEQGKNLDKEAKLTVIERRIRNFMRHHAVSEYELMTGHKFDLQFNAAEEEDAEAKFKEMFGFSIDDGFDRWEKTSAQVKKAVATAMATMPGQDHDGDIVKITGISEDLALKDELGISFDEAYEQYMCARLGLEKGSLSKYSVQELEKEVEYWAGRESSECIRFLRDEIDRRTEMSDVETAEADHTVEPFGFSDPLQLFGVPEIEADAYYAFEEAKYAVDNGEAQFIEASDEEISRWHKAGVIYIDRTDNGAVYYNGDIEKIEFMRNNESIDISYDEVKELCYRYYGDAHRITPSGGVNGIEFYRKEDAEILKFLKTHPETAECNDDGIVDSYEYRCDRDIARELQEEIDDRRQWNHKFDLTLFSSDDAYMDNAFCPYCGEQHCDCYDLDGNPAHEHCIKDMDAETQILLSNSVESPWTEEDIPVVGQVYIHESDRFVVAEVDAENVVLEYYNNILGEERFLGYVEHSIEEFLSEAKYFAYELVDDTKQVETSTEEPAPVSQETEAVSYNSTDSSETVDNAQTAESVNNKEVDNSNSAEAEENIELREENTMINNSDYEAELLLDMQKKSRQQVRAKIRELNKARRFEQKRKAMIGKRTNVTVRKVSVGWNDEKGVYTAFSYGVDIQVSDLVAPFVRTEQLLRTVNRGGKLLRRRGSKDVIVVGFNMSNHMDKAGEFVMSDIAINEYNGYISVYRMDSLPGESPRWVCLSNGKVFSTLPKTAIVYPASRTLYTTSQGRAMESLRFTTVDRDVYHDLLDRITCGEFSKHQGKEVTMDLLANYTTRVSSHFSAAGGEEHIINSIIILNRKNDGVDGNAKLNGFGAWYPFIGSLVQMRPLTGKGAYSVIDPMAFNLLTKEFNVKEIIMEEISPEDSAQLDKMLDKSVKLDNNEFGGKLGVFDGYDGVWIHSRDAKVAQIICDLNVAKDVWDYTRSDYARILHIGSLKEKKQKESTQILKTFMAVAAMAGKVEEANIILKNIIDRHIESKLTLANGSIQPVIRSVDEIGDKPLTLVAQELGLDLSRFPNMMLKDLQDRIQSLNNDIQLMSFGIKGKFEMIQPDMAGDIYEQVLYVRENGIIQLYVPGLEGRAVMYKYPCSGLFEFALVEFVSLDTILDRISKLNISDNMKKSLALQYKKLQPNTITIPTDDLVKKLLAGLDCDGDEVLLVLEPALVNFMHEYGKSIAVNIVAPKDKTARKVKIDDMAFARYAHEIFMNGNETTGAVTNFDGQFTEAWIVIKSHAVDRQVLRYFAKALDIIGNHNHCGRGTAYVSPLKREIVNGIEVVTVDVDGVNAVFEQAKNMARNEENALAFLLDMSYVGRFWQELTIDAQKNFYDVVVNFFNEFKEEKVRLIRTRYALNMALTIDKETRKITGMFYDDSILKSAITEHAVDADDHLVGTWELGDCGAQFRAYAVEKVEEMMKSLIDTYNVAIEDEKRRVAHLQTVLHEQHDELFYAIGAIGRMLAAIHSDARMQIEEVMKRTSKINGKFREHARKELVKAIKLDYLEIMSQMTNMVRRVSVGYTADELALRLEAMSVGTSAVGVVCREEMLQHLLNQAKATYKHIVDIEDNDSANMLTDGESVYVSNSTILAGSGITVDDDIPDGVYHIERNGRKVFVTAPASQVVTIPDHDNSYSVVMIEKQTDTIKNYLRGKKNPMIGIKSVRGNYLNAVGEDHRRLAVLVNNAFASSSVKHYPASGMIANMIGNRMVEVKAVMEMMVPENGYAKMLMIVKDEGEYVCPKSEDANNALDIYQEFCNLFYQN